jgi:hypothetical protein
MVEASTNANTHKMEAACHFFGKLIAASTIAAARP